MIIFFLGGEKSTNPYQNGPRDTEAKPQKAFHTDL